MGKRAASLAERSIFGIGRLGGGAGERVWNGDCDRFDGGHFFFEVEVSKLGRASGVSVKRIKNTVKIPSFNRRSAIQ